MAAGCACQCTVKLLLGRGARLGPHLVVSEAEVAQLSVRSLTGPPLQRYTALLRRHRSGPLPLLRLATQVVNALGTLLRYRRLNLPRILEIFKRFVWVFLRAKTEWARTHHSTDVLLSDMGPKLDEY